MKKKIILCIDDEKMVLDSLKMELKAPFGDDYRIELTESGNEALDFFKGSLANGYEIPLVICDYIMPDLRGDDVLRQIKALIPSTYCIMLTGLATITGIVNAINKAGLYHFIGKPWETSDLILTLTEALNSYKKDKELEKIRIDLENANRKLLKLDSSKNYFLGLLSHELNTPLTGINGNAKLISQISNDDEIIECANLILESESRLRKFAELSLLITRIQTDKYISSFNKESLRDIINLSIARMKDLLNKRNIKLENIFFEEDVFIFADFSLLTKVFDFIIENAIKYSEDYSTIYIHTEIIDNNCIVSITDEGKGFSEEALENMFQLFTSTDDLLTHSEGTGLSLAATKVILDLHNFGIKTFNSPKGGAICQLILTNSTQ